MSTANFANDMKFNKGTFKKYREEDPEEYYISIVGFLESLNTAYRDNNLEVLHGDDFFLVTALCSIVYRHKVYSFEDTVCSAKLMDLRDKGLSIVDIFLSDQSLASSIDEYDDLLKSLILAENDLEDKCVYTEFS